MRGKSIVFRSVLRKHREVNVISTLEDRPERKPATNPRSLALTLVLWFLVCFAVAALGSWFTSQSVQTWYPTIEKPSWNPPNWVFPLVWTTLFAMMAVAVARVHWRVGWDRSLLWFGAQLTANLTWSVLFFYFHLIGVAAVEILVLECLIVATVFCFRKRDWLAAVMMIPYALWVAFAAVLNWTILFLNT